MGSLHQQLLDPAAYPETTQHVDFAETHISRIYLTDRHAYKFKKPLDLGFLDFSTLDKRLHFCREEVRLNRRFSPQVYLGVVELREYDGILHVQGHQGRLIDYAVQMQRLPESRMLNRMVDAGAPELPDEMARLGEVLHRIIESMEVCDNAQHSNAETVRSNCEENFSQTQTAIGTALTEQAHNLMRTATRRDLSGLTDLMLEREADGFIRDGHGDLHTANICMIDPICIYDCIEFNRRFRIADVAADLAFLIMDLEYRGRRDLAETLVASYQAWSNDRHLTELLPFYKRYRAWVRGKVDSILASEPEVPRSTRDEASILARRYFNLALGYLLEPTLFLVTGLMGVGKTTLCQSLAAATGAKPLRSDVIRKELVNIPATQPCAVDFGAGLYSNQLTARTYDALYTRSVALLKAGRSVIVDASFADRRQRVRFLALAQRVGVPVLLLHLQCCDRLALQRLDERVDDASDGRRELYDQQKAAFEPITTTNHLLKIDTSEPVDYNVQLILCRTLSDQEP